MKRQMGSTFSNAQTNAQTMVQTIAQTMARCLGLVAIAAQLSACGRTTKIYSDPVTTLPVAITSHLTSLLPNQFYDESVNLASVAIELDGATSTSLALRFQLKPGTNPAGSFNGNGVGNRALLGLGAYSGRHLSDISTLTFDTLNSSGSESLDLVLLVDPNCDGTTTKLLTALGSDLAPGVAESAGYARLTADITQAEWHSAAGDITDPNQSSTVLVPASGAPVSLSAFLTKYPNACLRNAINTSDDLPNTAATAGILLALGDPATTSAATVFVNRITVGADVYGSSTWSNP